MTVQVECMGLHSIWNGGGGFTISNNIVTERTQHKVKYIMKATFFWFLSSFAQVKVLEF